MIEFIKLSLEVKMFVYVTRVLKSFLLDCKNQSSVLKDKVRIVLFKQESMINRLDDKFKKKENTLSDNVAKLK
jgi:hypothetical protein